MIGLPQAIPWHCCNNTAWAVHCKYTSQGNFRLMDYRILKYAVTEPAEVEPLIDEI